MWLKSYEVHQPPFLAGLCTCVFIDLQNRICQSDRSGVGPGLRDHGRHEGSPSSSVLLTRDPSINSVPGRAAPCVPVSAPSVLSKVITCSATLGICVMGRETPSLAGSRRFHQEIDRRETLEGLWGHRRVDTPPRTSDVPGIGSRTYLRFSARRAQLRVANGPSVPPPAVPVRLHCSDSLGDPASTPITAIDAQRSVSPVH